MTGSYDSKKGDKKEELTVIEKYIAANKITPAEYAERYLQTGNSAMLAKAVLSLPNLKKEDKDEFIKLVKTILQQEKLPDDEKISNPKGRSLRNSMVLTTCYPSLFPDKNPQRFNSFLEEFKNCGASEAHTFWALDNLETANHDAALFSLEKAAKQRCIRANEALGVIWWRGKFGVPRNFDGGRECLMLALDNGSAIAATAMGNILLDIESSKPKNERLLRVLKSAHNYFHYAASQGHAYALIRLGYHYRFGLGVEKDREKALSMFKTVLDHTNPCYMTPEILELARDSFSRCRQDYPESNLPWLNAVPPPRESNNPNPPPEIEMRPLKPQGPS